MQQEDKTIKEQFQQLKLEDDRQAPPFARTRAAALAQREQSTQRWQRWGVRWVAVAALALLVCGAAWWSLHRYVMTPPLPLEAVLPTPEIGPRPVNALPPSSDVTVIPKLAVHRRHARHRPQPDLALISQWRSPTEFLLSLSGDSLLKTVPRFGESWVEIKTPAPEQKPEPNNVLEEQ